MPQTPNAADTLKIISDALALLPIGIATYNDIKKLLAKDADLKAALASTASDNAKTQASVTAWLAANPE